MKTNKLCYDIITNWLY